MGRAMGAALKDWERRQMVKQAVSDMIVGETVGDPADHYTLSHVITSMGDEVVELIRDILTARSKERRDIEVNGLISRVKDELYGQAEEYADSYQTH